MSALRSWSHADERRLMDNAHLSAKELAPLFGKTVNSVHLKLSSLRKRKPVQRENVAKIEFMMMVAGRRRA